MRLSSLLILTLVSCGRIDQGVDKAANFIEARKREDEEYRKERPEVIAKAKREQEAEIDEEIDRQVQVLCMQGDELWRRLSHCDEI